MCIRDRAGTGAQAFAATMVPAIVSISYVNYAIVAILGGIMAINGTTDVGSLASYLVFVRQAAAPINQFTQQSNFLLAALAGAERVFEVMDEAPEVDEGAVSLEKAGQGWAWHKPEGEDIPCLLYTSAKKGRRISRFVSITIFRHLKKSKNGS